MCVWIIYKQRNFFLQTLMNCYICAAKRHSFGTTSKRRNVVGGEVPERPKGTVCPPRNSFGTKLS